MIDLSQLRGRPDASSAKQALLDGTYSGTDARELALALLDATVNAQKLRNLRSHVHTEAPDDEAEVSVRELQAARDELAAALLAAGAEGKRVRLWASIKFEIEDAPFARRSG